MAKRQELVIIRSAGISAWEFLLPSVFAAFVIGLVVITSFNPVACAMLSRFESQEAKYFYNKQNLLEISDEGLWIRQKLSEIETFDSEEDENSKFNVIIHSANVSGKESVKLEGAIAFGFTPDDLFYFRVDSKTASLEADHWLFKNARMTFSDGSTESFEEYKIPTNLKVVDIQKSFSDPQVVSFWELPNFIEKLNKSGFNDISHVMHYFKLLALPCYFAAMVLIGSLFSLKAPRQGKIGYSITISIVFGFLIYFVSNIIYSLGLSSALPVFVAAFAPALITAFIGMFLLLHFEDG